MGNSVCSCFFQFRGNISGTNCGSGIWPHSGIRTPHAAIFLAFHSLPVDYIRPGRTLTRWNICAVYIDEQMLFGAFFINILYRLHPVYALGFHKVKFHAGYAFVRPIGQPFPLFLGIQIYKPGPHKEGYALAFSIGNQIVKVLVVSFVTIRGAGLPAFIQKQIFPTHFRSQIHIFTDGFRIMLPAMSFCQPHPCRNTRLHPGEISGCSLTEIIGQIALHNIGKTSYHTVSPWESKPGFYGNIHNLNLRQFFSQFLISIGIDFRTGHPVLRGFYGSCCVFQSIISNAFEDRTDVQIAIHLSFADQNPKILVYSCQWCLEEIQSFCTFDLYRRETGLIGVSLQKSSGGNLRSP